MLQRPAAGFPEAVPEGRSPGCSSDPNRKHSPPTFLPSATPTPTPWACFPRAPARWAPPTQVLSWFALGKTPNGNGLHCFCVSRMQSLRSRKLPWVQPDKKHWRKCLSGSRVPHKGGGLPGELWDSQRCMCPAAWASLSFILLISPSECLAAPLLCVLPAMILTAQTVQLKNKQTNKNRAKGFE